jgi:hypothetical protein
MDDASVSRLNNSEYELSLKSTIDISLNIGSNILLKCLKCRTQLNFTTEVVSYNNIIIVKSDNKDFFDISRVIIYGEEVNDFHTIDYNCIFTYGISSIKELDRQLQAEKEKTYILQGQYNDLLARIESLENR